MDIYFSPQRSDDILELEVRGEFVLVNGEELRAESGVVTVVLPHGPNPTEAQRFPGPILGAGDGPVDLSKIEPTRRELPQIEDDPVPKRTVTKEQMESYNEQFRKKAFVASSPKQGVSVPVTP
jgi:hypothetical protein